MKGGTKMLKLTESRNLNAIPKEYPRMNISSIMSESYRLLYDCKNPAVKKLIEAHIADLRNLSATEVQKSLSKLSENTHILRNLVKLGRKARINEEEKAQTSPDETVSHESDTEDTDELDDRDVIEGQPDEDYPDGNLDPVEEIDGEDLLGESKRKKGKGLVEADGDSGVRNGIISELVDTYNNGSNAAIFDIEEYLENREIESYGDIEEDLRSLSTRDLKSLASLVLGYYYKTGVNEAKDDGDMYESRRQRLKEYTDRMSPEYLDRRSQAFEEVWDQYKEYFSNYNPGFDRYSVFSAHATLEDDGTVSVAEYNIKSRFKKDPNTGLWKSVH